MSPTPTRMPTTFRASAISLSGPAPPWSRMRRRSSGGRPAGRGRRNLRAGTKTVKILHAPGHTPDSVAILADGHRFTGDALFVGGAGRTDFMGGSASDLFDTFRTFEALPNPTVVHPGHNYAGRAGSTIGEEKAQNPLLRERDRTVFVSRLSVKTPPPANIAAIIRHNLGELDAATIAPRELRPLLEQEAAPSFSTCAVGSSSRASASTERG